MEEKKIFRIDLDELCSAMEDSSYEHNYYLDMETGEILLISDYMDEEEIEKLSCMIDEDPEQYKKIPRAESHEGYEDMEDFIATVEDEHLAELLEVAIAGKGAFRRFKDVLARHPKERERWFRFKDEIMRQRALEWLDDIGIRLAEE
jgi:hypothetical protein